MCICPHPSKASLGFFVVNQKDVLENQPLWESYGMNQKKLQEEQILISVKLVVAERERRTCASLTFPAFFYLKHRQWSHHTDGLGQRTQHQGQSSVLAL